MFQRFFGHGLLCPAEIESQDSHNHPCSPKSCCHSLHTTPRRLRKHQACRHCARYITSRDSQLTACPMRQLSKPRTLKAASDPGSAATASAAKKATHGHNIQTWSQHAHFSCEAAVALLQLSGLLRPLVTRLFANSTERRKVANLNRPEEQVSIIIRPCRGDTRSNIASRAAERHLESMSGSLMCPRDASANKVAWLITQHK